jgi:phosphoglycerate dehydrogenase-like enzyme
MSSVVQQAVNPTLRILLSEQALGQHQAAIAEVMGTRPFELVSIESAVASGRTDIDIAFISRDVTGRSTKHELAPALQACYTVLRESINLQWVHIHSAGADRQVYLDLRARGVQIHTSSGANAEVVAQMALAGLLALARKFPQLMAAQRERRWAPRLGSDEPRDLAGQAVVLIGWGPIGQRIADFLRLLGMKLIVVRHSWPTAPVAQASSHTVRVEPVETLAPVQVERFEGVRMVRFAELPQVLPQADWLLLACPLTEQTRHLVDAKALALMPRGAGLINVARGEVVVEADVIDALRSGQLGSAYLDVFEHEPLPADSPLWAMEKVIITPHTAGHADGNAQRVAVMFLENLQRWCGGVNFGKNAAG